MEDHQIDFETYLVAEVLRDKLFRVSPFILRSKPQAAGDYTGKNLLKIVDALFAIGVMTPVLIDSGGAIIAGQGLVKAAMQIGLEDIPALRLEDLSAEERRIYIKMTFHFFRISGLDSEAILIEAQNISAFAADVTVAINKLASLADAVTA